MQIFCPYPQPIDVAMCLDRARLNKQIIECHQILFAIDGTGRGWRNHPVVKMYEPYKEWLECYAKCLGCYQWCLRERESDDEGAYRLLLIAIEWSRQANSCRPPFLTEEFCNQHKRRLYTKNPDHYWQFSEYGTSDENWYVVDGELLKYVNGKRI